MNKPPFLLGVRRNNRTSLPIVSGRSTCIRGSIFSFRFAVPGESFGLTLILRFSDRCRNPAMPFSATGSGIPGFRARQRLIGSIATRGKRATNQALLRPTSDTCSCAEDKSLPRTDKSPPRFFCFNEPGPVIPTDPTLYFKRKSGGRGNKISCQIIKVFYIPKLRKDQKNTFCRDPFFRIDRGAERGNC